MVKDHVQPSGNCGMVITVIEIAWYAVIRFKSFMVRSNLGIPHELEFSGWWLEWEISIFGMVRGVWYRSWELSSSVFR